MQSTPKGLRLHIGMFGRRNVGKSALLNAFTRQAVSIVSETAGTTTDPVEKAMELRPLGPVLFVDTAGVDDTGALGTLRVQKTMQVVDRADFAILATDDWQDYERRLLKLFQEKNVPVLVALTKSDLRAPAANAALEAAARASGAANVVPCSAVTGAGLDALRQALITSAPDAFLEVPALIGDLVHAGDLVVLVVPVDTEAPKGRLILPQVQTLRDLLDNDAYGMVVKDNELGAALARLRQPPALVVTDSQAFRHVSSVVPPDVPLTSFSILYARFKGDLATLARGARAIDTLRPGDRVLIAEACTHHPSGDDIGRVKIPRWLEKIAGGKLQFTVASGAGDPPDLASYRLIVHCGACVWNRRQMLARLDRARAAGVPITNYGLAIAHCLGILDRALAIFPAADKQVDDATVTRTADV